jgi:hypothetical protein
VLRIRRAHNLWEEPKRKPAPVRVRSKRWLDIVSRATKVDHLGGSALPCHVIFDGADVGWGLWYWCQQLPLTSHAPTSRNLHGPTAIASPAPWKLAMQARLSPAQGRPTCTLHQTKAPPTSWTNFLRQWNWKGCSYLDTEHQAIKAGDGQRLASCIFGSFRRFQCPPNCPAVSPPFQRRSSRLFNRP